MKKYVDSGSLFINEKRSSDRAPTMTGYLEVSPALIEWMRENVKEGAARVRLSAWRKVSSNGREFLSVSVQQDFEQEQKPSAPQRSQPSPKPDLDDEIPF